MTPNAEWVLVVGEEVFETSSAVPGDVTSDPEAGPAAGVVTFGVAAADLGRLAALGGRVGYLLGADGIELARVRIRRVDAELSVLVAVLEGPQPHPGQSASPETATL